MRTAAATTFHKARYQNALIATAAPTRTKLPATSAPPTEAAAAAAASATTNTSTVNKRTRDQHQPKQQQTTNKTWPPGSSSVGRATASTANTLACAPSEADNQLRQRDLSCEHQDQLISSASNLLSRSLASTFVSKGQSNVLQIPVAHKRVGHLRSSQQLNLVSCNRPRESQQQSGQNSNSATPTTALADASHSHSHQSQPGPAQSARQLHEYQELSTEGDEHLAAASKDIRSQENLARSVQQRQQSKSSEGDLQKPVKPKRSKPKHLAMATLRPISPQYQHTLDSAISLSKELASKNMADSGESSPKTPNSPDKKRFNFKLKHYSKSYSEASASIRDIESSISDEAKEAYKSLVDGGQFNWSHQPFGYSGGGRSFNSYRNSPSARDYANDDFPTPTTPPATTSKFKYSTFSVKKSFF